MDKVYEEACKAANVLKEMPPDSCLFTSIGYHYLSKYNHNVKIWFLNESKLIRMKLLICLGEHEEDPTSSFMKFNVVKKVSPSFNRKIERNHEARSVDYTDALIDLIVRKYFELAQDCKRSGNTRKTYAQRIRSHSVILNSAPMK